MNQQYSSAIVTADFAAYFFPPSFLFPFVFLYISRIHKLCVTLTALLSYAAACQGIHGKISTVTRSLHSDKC